MSISSILTSRGLLNASRANQAPVDVLTLTVAEAQRLLHERHITGVELISKYLEQIRNHNHAGLKLNAVIATPPTDAVLQRARELDEERLAGKVRGPFHGIPILLKVRSYSHI
jgi:amidase